ncbi:MAG: aldo/keto reductase [Lentihominibacter sp.]|jgi:aryl-alcohol dehydrogenase-like predicted oxidoreductase/Pyruvate/2-oxoacid:ferredoxin oxidoreductase delta subunit
MKKIKLGNTDLYVTPVGLGVLTIGNTQLDLPLHEGADIVRYAWEKGINFFDTAQYYETYPYIREAFSCIDMSEGSDKRPIIASKSLDASYEAMERAINECLEALNIKTIDIFKLHEVRQDPDWDYRSGAWRCLKDYKAKGVVRAIGVSTHHVDVVERMAGVPECDIVFPLINYAGLGIRKGSGTGTAEEMAAAIGKCIAAGKGVFAMKVFGGGNLTGNYMKALNYVRDLGCHSLMIGMGNKKEIDNLADYAEGRLPDDFQPDVKFKKIHIDQGDCEGCMSCLERCPNKAIFVNRNGLADINYSICLTCGYCAPVCPVRAIIMW